MPFLPPNLFSFMTRFSSYTGYPLLSAIYLEPCLGLCTLYSIQELLTVKVEEISEPFLLLPISLSLLVLLHIIIFFLQFQGL